MTTVEPGNSDMQEGKITGNINSQSMRIVEKRSLTADSRRAIKEIRFEYNSSYRGFIRWGGDYRPFEEDVDLKAFMKSPRIRKKPIESISQIRIIKHSVLLAFPITIRLPDEDLHGVFTVGIQLMPEPEYAEHILNWKEYVKMYTEAETQINVEYVTAEGFMQIIKADIQRAVTEAWIPTDGNGGNHEDEDISKKMAESIHEKIRENAILNDLGVHSVGPTVIRTRNKEESLKLLQESYRFALCEDELKVNYILGKAETYGRLRGP